MLILLENQNRILYESVFSTFSRLRGDDPNAEEKDAVIPMDVNFHDFDGVAFRVLIDPDDMSVMNIYMYIPCWQDLVLLGARERLSEIFGNYYTQDEDEKWNAILSIPLDGPPDDCEGLAERISLLKPLAFGSPFHTYFTQLANGGGGEAAQVNISDDTVVFFAPGADRCTVIFSLNFKEKADEVIAKNFLQTISDKSKGSMPPTRYDANPPDELRNYFGIEDPIGNAGFISFAVLERHVNSADKIDNAANMFVNFRQYLSYHVKCAKTYFHSSMRLRVKELLGTLNQAKNTEGVEKKKKTFSGKTFNERKF